MQEELISFDTAKLAKEKGLISGLKCTHIYCIGYNVIPEDKTLLSHDYIRSSVENQFHLALAPTQSLLQKWLREIYNIHIIVYIMENSDGSIYYDFGLKQVVNWLTNKSSKPREFLTYEEALEIGLQEALKLVPTKK